MRRLQILIYAGLTLFVFSANAKTTSCERIFNETRTESRSETRTAQMAYGIGHSVGKLVKEYREVGPARLFFRPVDRDPRPKSYGGLLTELADYNAGAGPVLRAWNRAIQFIPGRLVGLLRGETGHLHDFIHGDPRYALTPIDAFQYHLLDRPVYAYSSLKKLRQRYVSSLVLSLATIGVAATTLQIKVVEPYLEARNAEVVRDAVTEVAGENRLRLIELIKYDVRVRDIREQLVAELREVESEAETKQAFADAIELALLRAKSTRTFIEGFKIGDFKPTVENLRELVRYPQFEHLIERIPRTDEGLDEAKWQKIVRLNWLFHSAVELAPSFLKNGPVAPAEVKDPLVRTAFETIYSGDFMRQVRELQRTNRISSLEATNLIGEALLFRTRAAESRTLNARSALSMTSSDFENRLLSDALTNRQRWDLR
jgi:hypothetical protein